MVTKNRTMISDSGHGWLSVPIDDLVKLDIVDKITRYSYISPTRVYLEEDCDAGTYLRAAEEIGWKVNVKHSFTGDHWHGRNWPSYDSYWVTNKFKAGATVSVLDIAGQRINATVVQNGRGYKIEAENGITYRAHKKNPLQYIYRPN